MRRLLAGLALLFAFPAIAHVTSTGLAVLQVDGGRLSYSLTLVATEQDGEMGRVLEAAADGNAAAVERVAGTLRDAAPLFHRRRRLRAGTHHTPGLAGGRRQGRAGDGAVLPEGHGAAGHPG